MMTGADVGVDRSMWMFRDELAQLVASRLLELDLVETATDDSWKRFHRV